MRRMIAAAGIGLGAALIAAGTPFQSVFNQPPVGAVRLPPVNWQQVKRIDPGVLAGLIPAPQSRLAYAQACAVDIGTIPDYDCMSQGVPIPTTKNGIEYAANVGDNDCDRPTKLPMAEQGQCIHGSRLVDLSPPSRPDVTIMAICRRYHPMAANSTLFNDLAVIAHNRKTGTTCFFQSPVDQSPGPFDGSHVPSPMSSAPLASTYWLEPAADQGTGIVHFAAPGGIACTGCHDSDPFILSPWIKQVAKLGEWDPQGKYLVDRVGPFSDPDQRPWVTAKITLSQPHDHATACFGCHRFGGSSLHRVAEGPGGLTGTDGTPNFHGFMPLGDATAADAWLGLYGNAVAEIDACLQTEMPGIGCNVRRAGKQQ